VTANGEHGLDRFPSKGVWLVMVVSYEPLLQPEAPTFQLRADGNTFSTNLSGFGGHLVQPEMPARGPLAFELPSVPRSAALLISDRLTDNNYQEMNAPLDSRLVITIPLSGSETRSSLNLSELSDR
jgi:hypothetical protein